MPPRLTPERILDKLVELRIFVTDHVDALRTRHGCSVLRKLRQTTSKEEKAWYNFLNKKTRFFSDEHLQHLAGTYDLISDSNTLQQDFPPEDTADDPHLSIASSELSPSAGPHPDYASRPGFTATGYLVMGGMQIRKEKRA